MAAEIKFNGRGMEITEAIKKYVSEKISRLNNIQHAKGISCELGENASHKGVSKDFYIRFLLDFPKAPIRIKKEGSDLYTTIDETMLGLQKMINHYIENQRKWEGQESWPKYEIYEDTEDVVNEPVDTQYANYVPKLRRKKIDMNPLSVAEAIQHMEFLGRDFFMFKDLETNKLCVVYRDNAEYVVLVPTD